MNFIRRSIVTRWRLLKPLPHEQKGGTSCLYEDEDDSLLQRRQLENLDDTSHSASIPWLLLNILILSLSTLILILSLAIFTSTTSKHSQRRNENLRMFSSSAPMLDHIDIAIGPKRMDATLLENVPLSIFRQLPSPEVDAAWRKISNLAPIAITREDVIAAGKSPDDAMKFDESFGLGSESYGGRIDVFHQIHCLDAIRRDVYWDYYYKDMYPQGFNESGELHQLHASHCIYLLLQNIMCNANVDIYTHIWTDAVATPFADFNIDHQCRDFNAVLKWQEENSVDIDKFLNMRRPENAIEHKMSRRFKEVNGFYDHYPDKIGEETGNEMA